MKYLSKNNIKIVSVLSILLLIIVSLVLCNSSIAHYKTRIKVDMVNLKITPYQPVNIVVEEISVDNTSQEQQENLNENESLIEALNNN